MTAPISWPIAIPPQDFWSSVFSIPRVMVGTFHWMDTCSPISIQQEGSVIGETYQEAYVIFDEYSEVQKLSSWKLSRFAKNFRGFRNPRFWSWSENFRYLPKTLEVFEIHYLESFWTSLYVASNWLQLWFDSFTGQALLLKIPVIPVVNFKTG